MKSPLFSLVGLAGILCCITWACSNNNTQPETTPAETTEKKWQAHQAELRESLQEAKSLTAIKVPILKSSLLEKKWGKPEIYTSPEGLYRLYYNDPESSFDNFTITGSPEPLLTFGETPPPMGGMGPSTPQEWQSTRIMGQEVKYFIETSGGNNGEMWATEAFSLTSPDGRVGYYRLQTEFNDLESPERFSKVGW
ncbi:hypothetical protein [Roseibacillus persicicus]|uniref:hypothetical protein n=1 Tax=Roseibacillus persicicus TaxID=454148 RepID=UPI00280E1C9C|nr:hypothetical protein [Roseibacillus persicicus]MDQ8189258.1 hypothetical protein [Roseibacillus persicicus]